MSGTGDDNCHYQGVECLINELIRLNKQFRMFAYPNRLFSLAAVIILRDSHGVIFFKCIGLTASVKE